MHLGTSAFTTLARSQAKAQGHADLPLAIVEHPFSTRTRDEVRTIARQATEDIVRALLGREVPIADAAKAAGVPFKRAELIDVPDDFEAFNQTFFDHGWSDGLPLTPPTAERVQRMLGNTRRAPDCVVAPIAPKGVATVESIAINAVMAGCHPEYLPVLIAATEAMGDDRFKIGFIQSTIHPTTTWLIINGPMAQKLKVNSGVNCLGPGAWANATLGRALRLIALNIGGGVSGEVDTSTHGTPAKYSMCCAENESESPWEPLHIERGCPKGSSAVTVIAAKSLISFLTHTHDVDDFIKVIGNTMMTPTGSEYRSGGAPALVLSPEHARLVAKAGLSKAEFKRRVWEASRMPLNRMSAKEQSRTQVERKSELGDFGPDDLLPVSPRPEDITVIVAGGAGMLSSYVPCHAPISQAVTRVIEE